MEAAAGQGLQAGDRNAQVKMTKTVRRHSSLEFR
jgi:hypothetical protein